MKELTNETSQRLASVNSLCFSYFSLCTALRLVFYHFAYIRFSILFKHQIDCLLSTDTFLLRKKEKDAPLNNIREPWKGNNHRIGGLFLLQMICHWVSQQ